MNPRLLFLMLVAVMFSAACAPLDSPPRPDLWGDPAPVAAATQTIVITPNTKYVNVTGGEIVTFVVGDKAFAWSFNGTRYVAPFDLSMTAPPGVLDHAVIACVAPGPRYMGAGGTVVVMEATVVAAAEAAMEASDWTQKDNAASLT